MLTKGFCYSRLQPFIKKIPPAKSTQTVLSKRARHEVLLSNIIKGQNGWVWPARRVFDMNILMNISWSISHICICRQLSCCLHLELPDNLQPSLFYLTKLSQLRRLWSEQWEDESKRTDVPPKNKKKKNKKRKVWTGTVVGSVRNKPRRPFCTKLRNTAFVPQMTERQAI
jgi:hypothetical protein